MGNKKACLGVLLGLVFSFVAGCTSVGTGSEPGVTDVAEPPVVVSHDGTIPSGPLGPENYVGTIDRYGDECGLQNVTGHGVTNEMLDYTANFPLGRDDEAYLRAAYDCMAQLATSDGANYR
jgi:hypothetical protein